MTSFLRAVPKSLLRSAAAPSLRTAPVLSASRAFSMTVPSHLSYWKAKEIPDTDIDMPINPGVNPDPKNIGVNAVLKRRPETMDKHVTTIFAEFSLLEKTAVVTGGNRGLGLEMALAFVEAGAEVYVIDMADEPSEDFKKVAQHCRKLGRRLTFITADVTNEKQMNEAMDFILEDTPTKTLDVCMANAGIMQTFPAIDYPVDKFRKMLDVNTTGVFITAKSAARIMRKRPDLNTSIILTASMSGTVVNRDQQWVAYNTSKAAVLQMGRNLAAEWGPHNIRVNTLSPGYIRTNLVSDQLDTDPEMLARWSDANPLGRIGRPHELRGVVVWLASAASSFCNGADIIVSGGHTIW
ncbi:oxidoreductase [Malassezia pachydermatis]|uniref:Sorbose reductase sou1 n=1 Tax=Malassezia pachydermatis TaxID=77020 RepID=A0A0M8MM84_9BASI|nr:sorbose reductase sou1 [Malassezia pachydermatis]KOS12957.1 sorbose reductase sou1 [Malassezia pachydermatis]